MSQIPAHLLAILSRSVNAAPLAVNVPVRDRAPVFTPSQSSVERSPRSLVAIMEECTLEVHECPMMDNEDPDNFALAMGD